MTYRHRQFNFDYSDPRVVAALTEPGALARLEAAIDDGTLPPHTAIQLLKDLAQHARALDGDRAQPGTYLDDPRLPTEPMPFQRREEFHPDRAPGTRGYEVMTTAVHRMKDTGLVRDLSERLDTPSQVAAIEAREASEPPSLRESITAAAEAVTGQIND